MTCVQQSVMNLGILMVQGLVNSFGAAVMAAFAAAVVCTILTAVFGNKWLALAELVLIVAVCVAVFICMRSMRKAKTNVLSQITEQLSVADENSAEKFPMPMAVCGMGGELIWYNSLFQDEVLGGTVTKSEMKGFFEDIGIDAILNAGASGMPFPDRL